MYAADLLISRERGGKPGLFQQGLRKQRAPVGYELNEAVHPASSGATARRHPCPIHSVGQERSGHLPLLQQFQQPVLRRDFCMRTGLT